MRASQKTVIWMWAISLAFCCLIVPVRHYHFMFPPLGMSLYDNDVANAIDRAFSELSHEIRDATRPYTEGYAFLPLARNIDYPRIALEVVAVSVLWMAFFFTLGARKDKNSTSGVA